MSEKEESPSVDVEALTKERDELRAKLANAEQMIMGARIAHGELEATVRTLAKMIR